MKRTEEILAKIKEGHPLWDRGNFVYRKRLEKAFDPLFIELETLGVARHFSEALLFFGEEFVELFGDVFDDDRRLDQAGLPVTVEDVEKIFEVKAKKMTDREIREAKLAEKSWALVYRSEPMKGSAVGIKILTYKKKLT